jgi:hypothetical protein
MGKIGDGEFVMRSFSINSSPGVGSIEFFERTPTDVRRPVERFKVRLTAQDLSAVARVYASGAEGSPVAAFARMAEQWRGWADEIAWNSSADELSIRCTRDRTGHVFIHVELRSGPTQNDWVVRATIVAEAGQLAEISRQAELFFGHRVASV